MTISIPAFDGSFCQLFGICSHITEPASNPLPEEDIDITSSVRPEKVLTRLLWDRKSQHFHVDIAQRAFFGKKPPKPNQRLMAFRKALSPFEGVGVKAHIHGIFSIPLSILPPAGGLIFTGSSAIRLRSGKSEIELTGANLSFKNADISRIRWEVVGGVVMLEVSVKRNLIVGPSYLADAFRVLESAVATYILGKKADEKTS